MKPLGDGLDKEAVVGAREAVDVGGVPSSPIVQPDFEGVGDSSQGGVSDGSELTVLDPAHDDVGDSGAPSDVALPEASAHTDEAEERAEGEGIHARESCGRPLPRDHRQTHSNEG